MNVIELYQKAIDKSTSGWRNTIWFSVKYIILATILNAIVIINFPFLLLSFYLGAAAVFLSIDVIAVFTVFTFDAIMFSFNQEIKMPSELEYVDAEPSPYVIINPFEEVKDSNVVKAHKHAQVDDELSQSKASLFENSAKHSNSQDLENDGGYTDVFPDEPSGLKK
jgi:hypothetical protein